MLLSDLFISLLTMLVISLLASYGFGWLFLHYPNRMMTLTVILISLFVSLIFIVTALRFHAKSKKTKLNNGVIIGKSLVIGKDTITFRRKRILDKYIVFPEINGKRDESLYEFISSPEDSEITAAVNRLISSISTVKCLVHAQHTIQ